ncbi:hypothetical protein BJX68DRAFT_135826 [Aspergillus pseudodeflectus]|uniref:Uncharacterized protein n=1 Tax=Aspergillus pseudodeflectus TaxID=176178 RepID=A0ABR4K017_9EURO
MMLFYFFSVSMISPTFDTTLPSCFCILASFISVFSPYLLGRMDLRLDLFGCGGGLAKYRYICGVFIPGSLWFRRLIQRYLLLCVCALKKRLQYWCIVGSAALNPTYLLGNRKVECCINKNIRRMQSQGKHHPIVKALMLSRNT